MFRLRDYIEIAMVAQELSEKEGISYKDGIEKAKEMLGRKLEEISEGEARM